MMMKKKNKNRSRNKKKIIMKMMISISLEEEAYFTESSLKNTKIWFKIVKKAIKRNSKMFKNQMKKTNLQTMMTILDSMTISNKNKI